MEKKRLCSTRNEERPLNYADCQNTKNTLRNF